MEHGFQKGCPTIRFKGGKGRIIGSYFGRNLVSTFLRLLDRDWEVQFRHIYHEANHCSYALANLSCGINRD